MDSSIILLISSMIIFFINGIIFWKTYQIDTDKTAEIQKNVQEIALLTQKQNYLQEIVRVNTQTSQLLQKECAYYEQQLNNKKNNSKKLYEELEQQYYQSYLKYANTIDAAYTKVEKQFLDKQSAMNDKIDQLRKTYDAAVKIQLKQQEEQDKWRFYSIHLTDNQATDISKLQEWKKDLSDPTIVSKIIWSTYYLKPVGELCNRVLGSDKVCGIYKLTDKSTGKIYIGQSVNVSDRFKQHIKYGLGIDTPSTSKLYNAMQNSSLWYWTFELIEKCPKEKLNERERFWINFYQSDKVGYNMTKGNK